MLGQLIEENATMTAANVVTQRECRLPGPMWSRGLDH